MLWGVQRRHSVTGVHERVGRGQAHHGACGHTRDYVLGSIMGAQVWHRCKMAARWCKMVVAHACGRAVAHRAEGLRSSSVVVGEGVSTRRSAVEVSLGARTVIKRGASEETPKKAVCELGQNEYSTRGKKCPVQAGTHAPRGSIGISTSKMAFW